jgi:hypothetical protein
MTTSFLRLLAILLGIGLGSAAEVFRHEKVEPKETPFQKTASSLLVGCAMHLSEYGHFPHFTSWSRVRGGNVDAADRKRYKDFPDVLMKALVNRESVDHATAVAFLANYANLARIHAANFSEKDLSVAVDHALAPHTGKIREALVAILQAKTANTRLMAAMALLCLDENHVKANEVFQASVMLPDVDLSETSRFIALAHLTSPQAINYLRRLLKHRDMRVRHGAASAAITLGRSARDLAPALIALLETGKDAEGSYEYPFAIAAVPQSGNLALMALESLEEHAKPAVPAILKRFAKANDEDQLAMLACLAHSGHKGDACLAIVRKSLRSEKSKLKLAAACTLLHLTPRDREATDLLKNALADDTTKNLALEICQQFGPPSPEIVASLLPMLDNNAEDVRINAMRALASIGPQATQAVAGLEKLLAKEEDAMTHTFQSTEAAARALAKIRGKEAAAALLRVADSKTSGAYPAIKYLPKLGDDLPPATLEVLVRAIRSDDRPKEMAAMALSNLGERARPVRRELERLHEDPEVGWIIDTALRRIPANPR